MPYYHTGGTWHYSMNQGIAKTFPGDPAIPKPRDSNDASKRNHCKKSLVFDTFRAKKLKRAIKTLAMRFLRKN